MTLGPLTFLAPLALLGLLALPLIWWLLRITPPKPLQQIFPPLRILKQVETEEETPNSTPLWLLLFRLLMVALIAIALAQPLFSKPEGVESRPIVLITDTGWDAAPNWPSITKEAENRILDARRKGVDVMLLTTTGTVDNAGFVNPADALRQIKALSPKPELNTYDNISKTLAETDLSGADVYWLSSGVKPGELAKIEPVFAKAANSYVVTPPANVLPVIPGYPASYLKPWTVSVLSGIGLMVMVCAIRM